MRDFLCRIIYTWVMDDEKEIRGTQSGKAWDADEALAALGEEASFFEETAEEQALRVFKENLVVGAQAIVHLARYSANEKIRLQAATYVVERNMGRLQDVQPTRAEDPFKALIGECVSEIEDFANTGKAPEPEVDE